MNVVTGMNTWLSKSGPPKNPALPWVSITPITRNSARPIRITVLTGSRSPYSCSRIVVPMTHTRRLYWTSYALKKRPDSGTALETSMCLCVVPTIRILSRVSDPTLMARWVPAVGLTAIALRSCRCSRSPSLSVRFGRLRNWKKRPVKIHGVRDTNSTSVPITEALSRKAFASPLAAVMVVATATMPMMIPRVVRTPRALFARIAATAIRNASTMNLMALTPPACSGCHSR